MKDTLYFPHDYNARRDPKLIRLTQKHGLSGIGAYWCIIELLYERDGKIPTDEYSCISFELHEERELIESVILDFGLFENDGNFFWSNSVNARLDKRKEISDKRKSAIATRWERTTKTYRKKGANTNVLQTDTKNKDKDKEYISTSNEVEYIGAKRTAFVPPTLEEVKAYILEKGYAVDAERFIDFYTSKGWMVGKNKMKDWKAAVRTWSKGNNTVHSPRPQGTNSANVNDEWL